MNLHTTRILPALAIGLLWLSAPAGAQTARAGNASVQPPRQQGNVQGSYTTGSMMRPVSFAPPRAPYSPLQSGLRTPSAHHRPLSPGSQLRTVTYHTQYAQGGGERAMYAGRAMTQPGIAGQRSFLEAMAIRARREYAPEGFSKPRSSTGFIENYHRPGGGFTSWYYRAGTTRGSSLWTSSSFLGMRGGMLDRIRAARAEGGMEIEKAYRAWESQLSRNKSTTIQLGRGQGLEGALLTIAKARKDPQLLRATPQQYFYDRYGTYVRSYYRRDPTASPRLPLGYTTRLLMNLGGKAPDPYQLLMHFGTSVR